MSKGAGLRAQGTGRKIKDKSEKIKVKRQNSEDIQIELYAFALSGKKSLRT